MESRTGPRSGQIVGELRRRIETGELAPGDRVPSTRDITRRWGVAMATATKVLTELRHEGLVRVRPGVGTVVAEGRVPRRARAGAAPRVRSARSATASEAALTPARIVETAIAIADAEGLDALSMRRVAAALGMATMSLYRHVADKDDLLMQMMDAVLSGWAFPADPPTHWRPRLELAGRMLWEAFQRHPWLAPALSLTRPQPVARGMDVTEWVLATLVDQGLDLSTALTIHLTLFNYVRGTAVNVEMEAEAQATTGLDNEEWLDDQRPALQAILAGGRFPTLARITAAGYDFDLDGLFEFGLKRLLDGVAVHLAEDGADGVR